MDYEQIPIEIFVNILKKLQNWKAPGTDHHYWYYKTFTVLRPLLHQHMNTYIQTPDLMPHFITDTHT